MDTKYPLGPPELPSSGPAAPSYVEPVDEETIDVLNEHVEEPGDPDGLVAADEKRQSRQYQQLTDAQLDSRPARKRRWPVRLVLLVIIVLAAMGAYWFGNHQADKASVTQAKVPATQSQNVTPISVLTKHYDSTTYTVGFDYPENWVVADNAAKLTVTSPSLQLTAQDTTKVSGRIVLTIQNPQSMVPGFPAAGAIAALESDKVTYKQPTSIQRAQTYVSYLGYGSQNALDTIFITGDGGYQQGQKVAMSDITKGNPLIGVAFEACSKNDCNMATTALSVLAMNWKSSAVASQVTSLIQSIQLN
jgi:hypothetical protein